MSIVSRNLGVDLRRLQLLAALHARGTIAAVAAVEHLTPSAVSQQLQSLAREVGVPLLERHGRKVVLTEHALVLVQKAREIEAVLLETRLSLSALSTGASGQVRVASFATGISRLIAPAMAHLRSLHPDVEVTVAEMDMRDAFHLLDAGDVEVVVAVDFPGAPSIADRRFSRVDLVVDVMDAIVPRGHRLSTQPYIALTDLAEEHWVGPATNDACGHIVAGLCAVAGFTPDVRHQCSDWGAVSALVAAGAGVSLLPRMAQPVHHAVDVVQLEGDPASRVIFALTRASGQSNAVSALSQALVRVGASRSAA